MARMPAHVLALLLLLPIAAIAADPPTCTALMRLACTTPGRVAMSMMPRL